MWRRFEALRRTDRTTADHDAICSHPPRSLGRRNAFSERTARKPERTEHGAKEDAEALVKAFESINKHFEIRKVFSIPDATAFSEPEVVASADAS